MDCDLLLKNGHFITLEPSQPFVSSIAIKNGRIAWLGNEWKGLVKKEIDLNGAYGYPGLVDAHMHILYAGLVQSYLHLHGISDQETVLRMVQERVQQLKPGDWLIGVGWDDHHWPKNDRLNALELDKVAPDNPVVLQRYDTHLMWVNTITLKLAGIEANTLDPSGGVIGRDATGQPNGILIDFAMMPVRKIWPWPDFEGKKELILSFLNDCLKKGLTSVHNAATDQNDFPVFEALALQNELPLRIYGMIAMRDDKPTALFEEGPRSISEFLQMRCLKFWMDGAMGSRGAALFEPYVDDAGNRGLLFWDQAEWLSILEKAKAKGFQVATHAIGDRASHLVLDAYEKIGFGNLRWRIEHAQQLIPKDIPRLGRLGVIASMQPLHEEIDLVFLEKRLGAKRVEEGSFPWRKLLASGTHLAGGSDAPVVDFNPLLGISAVSKTLTRIEALQMYTLGGAYAAFQETELGTLKVGKWADIAIFPEDILTCSPETLLKMDALYTIVGGKIAYAQNT